MKNHVIDSVLIVARGPKSRTEGRRQTTLSMSTLSMGLDQLPGCTTSGPAIWVQPLDRWITFVPRVSTVEALKALVMAQHTELPEQHESRTQRIEHLKLVIQKDRRMIFGR